MRHDSRIPASAPSRDTSRRWISGLAITLTTIVAYLAFWRLSPGITFLIGAMALVGLLVSLWVIGRED